MRKKFISLAGGLFLLTNFLLSRTIPEKIVVTSVQVKNSGSDEKIAEVILNDAVLIREIKFSKKDGQLMLKFPTYLAKNGKEYPQVRVLSKDAREIIQKAIASAQSSPGENRRKQYVLSYKITKFSLYNRHSSVKVFCAVAINGAIEIECRVMEGNYGPWIAWPARKDEGTNSYIKQVVITNTALRNAIEKALLKKYRDILREKSPDSSEGF